MKYMIKFPQRIYCTLYTQCIQDMSHIVYLFSLLSYLQKNATIQSIHRLFCVSASHRHVSYPTSCYGRSQAENVELHGWPSHQRRLTGREQRHLGGFRDDEIILLWDFPILELFFCQKSLSDSWYSYLGINIWEILIYIYSKRFIYTNKRTSVAEWDICFVLCFFMAQFRWGRLKTDSVKSWHWNIPADGLKTDSVNLSKCWILPLSRN